MSAEKVVAFRGHEAGRPGCIHPQDTGRLAGPGRALLLPARSAHARPLWSCSRGASKGERVVDGVPSSPVSRSTCPLPSPGASGSLKAGMLLTLPPGVAGAGPSSPHPIGAGASPPVRCLTRLRVPPHRGMLAGLWAPAGTSNSGSPIRYRCQADQEPAWLRAGPGAEQEGLGAGAGGCRALPPTPSRALLRRPFCSAKSFRSWPGF